MRAGLGPGHVFATVQQPLRAALTTVASMYARICTKLEVLLVLLFASTASAQERSAALPLSLEEALRRAEGTNEALVIAAAGVERARGERRRARSEYYPQIGGSVAFTRTFANEFSDFGGGGDGRGPPAEPCPPFTPDPNLPLSTRVDSLESAVICLSREERSVLGDLRSIFGDDSGPFGRGNRFDLGLTLDFPLYTGGRRRAQTRIAAAGLRSAEIEVTAQEAQLTFDVTRAYFDAVLADRLVAIAEQALAQAERTLEVTLVAVRAGNQPEFDALRARVARDNQRSVLLRRVAEREVALARLRNLVGLPIDQPLRLTTPLSADLPAAVTRRAPDAAGPDTVASLRSTVRQAEETVRIQENLVRIARSQRLPTVSLSGQFGQVAFPSFAIPSFADFRVTSSLTLGASIPIFTGGRIRGDIMVAEADLREARARLEDLRDLAAEDAYSSLAQLEAARATYEATGATIAEAERAYEIAELRYREGVASLLELTDTRLLLEEALANRAVAARDLLVAQARLALLPDLPLGVETGLGAGGAAVPGAGGVVAPASGAGLTRIRDATTSSDTGFNIPTTGPASAAGSAIQPRQAAGAPAP